MFMDLVFKEMNKALWIVIFFYLGFSIIEMTPEGLSHLKKVVRLFSFLFFKKRMVSSIRITTHKKRYNTFQEPFHNLYGYLPLGALEYPKIITNRMVVVIVLDVALYGWWSKHCSWDGDGVDYYKQDGG